VASGDALSHTTNFPGKFLTGTILCPFLPTPTQKSICSHAPQFSGSDQHDAQEFLSFLLDGLHEDLNRVLQKPQIQTTPEREAELERLPLQIANQQEWETYKTRNDSLIVDFFQGQFRNRMECLTCHKVRRLSGCFVADLTANFCLDVDNVQSFHVSVITDPSFFSRRQSSITNLSGRLSEQGGHVWLRGLVSISVFALRSNSRLNNRTGIVLTAKPYVKRPNSYPSPDFHPSS
jgi:hypothetical protein